MMNGFVVMTTDEKRAEKWLDWFGTEFPPVASKRARWVDGRNVYEVAYMLLPESQRNHFFGHVAQWTGQHYENVKLEMETCLAPFFPIRSDNCRVLVTSDVQEEETAVSQDRRPFFISIYDLLIYIRSHGWQHLRTKRAANRHLSPC